MTTHATATADLTEGPPMNNCQGELNYEEPVARDGTIWNVFRCDECGKRIFADFFARFGLGERFTEEFQQATEEPQQATEEPQQAEPQQATEEPQQAPARKRGRPAGSRNRKSKGD
jgi:hypothetical protein